MKILLTGSEGNIGRRLVPYLKSKGYQVFRFDIKQGWADDYMVGNICTSHELHLAFDRFKPDAVYHMAAMVSRVTCEASPAYTAEVNLAGVQNVIQLCLKHKARMIYFSTSEVYGNLGGELKEEADCKPNNFYGLTKYQGEKLVEYAVKNNGLQAVTVRPFMFYDEYEDLGEHRSAMIRFAEGLIKREKITIHAGAMRSWMHIDDAVKALEKCLFVKNYDIINIGHPEVISVDELADEMCEQLGIFKEGFIKTMALPEKMTLTKFPNLDKQTKVLKVVPQVTLKEGIKRVIDEVKKKVIVDKPVGWRDISSSQYWISSVSDEV